MQDEEGGGGLGHTPTVVLVDADVSDDDLGAAVEFKGLPEGVSAAKLSTFERHEDVCATVHEGAFSTSYFLSLLRTRRLGRTLLFSECTRSTQDMLGGANGDEAFRSRLGELQWREGGGGRGSDGSGDGCGGGGGGGGGGASPVPLLCLADRQTKGRGRGGNTWSSPLGCLLFSYSSRFRGLAEERLPFFQASPVLSFVASLGFWTTTHLLPQYLVSVALVRASTAVAAAARQAAADVLERTNPAAAAAVRSGDKLDIAIKWPNDIYVNARGVAPTSGSGGGGGGGGGGDGDAAAAAAAPGGGGDACGGGAAAAAAAAATVTTAAATPTTAASTTNAASTALKIGGILCQSSFDYKTKTFDVITGVGFNVENEEPTTCLRRLVLDAVVADLRDEGQAEATSSSTAEVSTATAEAAGAAAAVSATVTRERFLAEFLSEFEAMYAIFTGEAAATNAKTKAGRAKEGSISPGHAFYPFLSEYLSLWLHSGQEVSVSAEAVRESGGGSGDKDGQHASGDKDEGTAMVVEGLSHTGALLARRVHDGGGKAGKQKGRVRYELMPDGNSFDFFRGLIMKKV